MFKKFGKRQRLFWRSLSRLAELNACHVCTQRRLVSSKEIGYPENPPWPRTVSNCCSFEHARSRFAFQLPFEIRPSKSAGNLDFFLFIEPLSACTRRHGVETIFHTRHHRVLEISPDWSKIAKTMKRRLAALTIKVNRIVARVVARTRVAQGVGQNIKNCLPRPTDGRLDGVFGLRKWARLLVWVGCAEQRTSIKTVHIRWRCLFTRLLITM